MKKTNIIFLILLCMLLCTACFQKQENETTNTAQESIEDTTSEDTDSKCEVSYAPCSGEHSRMFLSEGDKVAVISPSALPSQKQVDATVEGLKEWGYVPVEGKYVCKKGRTLEECMEDLKWALEDPDIKAVFCVRGGYGASEVMDIMPMELIRTSEKLIIGYSDITIFHSAWTADGLPSIHASMSGAFMDLPEECFEAEQRILQGEIPVYQCGGNSLCKEGEAEGILIGGNLATFTAVLGTAYDCTQTDQPYILFLEEVGEDMQHIHRFLTILKHQGVLDRAAGIIFGEWTELPLNPGDYNGDSRGGTFESVADMISREILEEYDIPVAFGFPAGHGDRNYPLLMGEKVYLEVTEESFTISWNQS